MKQQLYRTRRFWRWSIFCGTLIFAVLIMMPKSVLASEPVDVGYRTIPITCITATTGEKPESKLWFHDGSWWGSLCHAASKTYHIYRFDLASQDWVDTQTELDNRSNSKADILWDEAAQKLYVASHVFTTSGAPTSTSSTWARLYRYSYAANDQRYTLDSGFPVTITRGKSETITVAKDSTGRLWVTYVESSRVMINHSRNGNDADWGVPYVLPVTNAANLTSDDISSVTSMDNRIGVMWSNQQTDVMYFATHLDSDSDDRNWQSANVYAPGGNAADDHINLKYLQSDAAGIVFAVTKTSYSSSQQPLIVLHVCGALPCSSAQWKSYTVSRDQENDTRPIVLIDTDNRELHVFTTGSGSGGEIRYKSTPLDNIQFSVGEGDLFIKNTGDLKINNSTSTKQNIDRALGILVAASSGTTLTYYHNYIDLGGGPAPTPPVITSFSPTSGVVGSQVTLTGSNFAGATAVTFNGTAATFVVDSSSQIRATVPAGATSGPLRVTTPQGSGVSANSFTVTGTSTTNQPPSVQAGPDQTVTLPSSVTLAANVSDDGLPNPPASLALEWTTRSGPGSVAFGSATTANTTATFSVAGVYVLRLTAYDGALSAYDEVTITVQQPSASGDIIYVSLAGSATVSGLSVRDEDILAFDRTSSTWAMYFDGSDVGLGASDVNAFEFLPDGSILMTFNISVTEVGGLTVTPVDIVHFIPTSFGPNTAGTFTSYFRGADVGLANTTGNAIDALTLTADGSLLMSTAGSFSVPGATGRDEDLLLFTPNQAGNYSSGVFSLYFDGSDVGLSESSGEDVGGVWRDSGNGDLYLTTNGVFDVPGLSGDGADIFICEPGSLGNNTSCTYRFFWDGSTQGLASQVVDGLSIDQGGQASGVSISSLRQMEDLGELDTDSVNDDGLIDPDDTETDPEHRLFLPSIQANE